jgi:hypothetical protein
MPVHHIDFAKDEKHVLLLFSDRKGTRVKKFITKRRASFFKT